MKTPAGGTTEIASGAIVRRVWDRDVPSAWTEQLYTHLPRTGPVVLMLAWEPGDPWRPIERWMLYETWSRWWVAEHDPDRLAELEGPNPRVDMDHYCAAGWCQCAMKKNKLVTREGGYSTVKIDYWQWRFYQQHGRSPLRYWTIQGTEGGHRFALTPYESRIWQQTKGISDTPAPGDLPYADFDARVLRDVVAYEPMRRKLLELWWRNKQTAMQAVIDAEEAVRVQQRTQAFGAMRERTGESAEMLRFAMKRDDPYTRGALTTRDERVAFQAAHDPDRVLHDAIHDL